MSIDPFKDLNTFNSISLHPEKIDSNNDGIADTHFREPQWPSDHVNDDCTFVEDDWGDSEGDTQHAKDEDSFDSISLHPERIDTNDDGITDAHFTDPHWVSGYLKDNGTFVEGYWRDGDGDTEHDLHKFEGGGYFVHDPYHSHE